MARITKRTIKQLRTAASRFFPNDDAYHTWISSEFGHGAYGSADRDYTSTLDLSEQEARQAIRKIDQMSKDRKRNNYPDRKEGVITFDQRQYIYGLFDACGIPEGKRRWGFIKKQIGTPKAIDWLTNREASKVITGLKRYRDSEYAKESSYEKS